MTKSDLIVLGATGFTGKLVVDYLVKLCKENVKEYGDLKWGIAGRSNEKLRELLSGLRNNGTDTSQITVIECDINQDSSLKKTVEDTKVLMNCTGPYTVLGEPVVKACVEAGTHYVDITAELHNMLHIYRKHNKMAVDNNVLVVPACGFASLPSAMGVVQLEKSFQGILNSIECYVRVDIPKRAYIPGPNRCLVHYGTWASLVHELRNFKEYEHMKKETFLEDIYGHEPEEIKKSFFHRHQGKLWFPYPGPDRDVTDMAQRSLREMKKTRPIHYKMYCTMPMFIHYIIVPVFFIYYLLSYFKCFRNLLWNFPRFFTLGYMSHKGPSKETMKDTKYSFTMVGKGWTKDCDVTNPPNKTMELKVHGVDAYQTTAIAFVLAAIMILKEASSIPRGGVLMSGAAFYDTNLVDKLNENGINYEIIND